MSELHPLESVHVKRSLVGSYVLLVQDLFVGMFFDVWIPDADLGSESFFHPASCSWVGGTTHRFGLSRHRMRLRRWKEHVGIV